MKRLSNSWLNRPDSDDPAHDSFRLETKVDELLTALETPDTPASYTQPPSGLLSYWRTIRASGWVIAIVAILGAAAGWQLSQQEQKVYQASSTMEMLEPGQTFSTHAPANNNPIVGDTYIDTQVVKLRSISLLTEVLSELRRERVIRPGYYLSGIAVVSGKPESELTEADVRTMRSNLGVSPVRGTSLIDVTYDSPDANLAAHIVNSLTNEYIQEEVAAHAGTAGQTRAWLQKELENNKVKLENSERQLQDYAHSSGLLYTSPKENVGEQTEEKLQFVAQELSASQAKRASLEARYKIAEAESAIAIMGEDESPTLHNIQSRLLDLKTQRALLAATFTPEYSKLKEVDAEIAELQSAQTKESARYLAQLRGQYETERQHEQLLSEAYQQQAVLVGDAAAKAIHYNVLKREVEINRNLYDSLLSGMKEAEVNAAARVRTARVVDPATPPSLPYRPNPVRNGVIGLLGGLMLGTAFVLMRATNDRRFKTPAMVTSYLNLPELGVIPSAKAHLMPTGRRHLPAAAFKSRRRLLPAFGADKAAPVANAFHSAVTSIFFSGRSAESPKLVVVTSGSAHEGKSTVAGNLGLMAAQTGKRVLLVDGDLRNPRLHQIYSASNDHGLTDLLLDDRPIDRDRALSMTQSTNVDGLHLLTSGPITMRLIALLHSDRLAETLAELRTAFDLILIDTPPVIQFADARIFGKLSDAVILVVRSGVTTRNLAQAARARFADDGSTVIGTILTDWSGKETGYEYSDAGYRN
jgi:polysaccharide biosynthesis transport protein